MPNISPLGLARQCTMLALRVRDAVEVSQVFLEPDRTELLEEADLWARQIRCWEAYANKEGWRTAEMHASTMGAMAEVNLLQVESFYGSPSGNSPSKPDPAGN